MIPARHATTRAARYVIGTAVGAVARGVDQSRARGSWLSLGTYELGTEVVVRLSARTGDPAAAGRTVAFDALRFVALAPPPPPPVISGIDVEARHDRAVVRFSLDARGPARTEYRLAGAIDWRPGSDETSSQYVDHRQVIDGLRPETAYELRVIATNAGGRTVSDIVRFTTTALPPPVIRDIQRRSRRDPRRRHLQPRREGSRPQPSTASRGPSDWRLGAEERGRRLREPPPGHRRLAAADRLRAAHRRLERRRHDHQRHRPLHDATAHRRLRRGRGPPEAAIDKAQAGDTLRIKGSCGGSFTIGKDLTLKGVSADAVIYGSVAVGAAASVEIVDLAINAQAATRPQPGSAGVGQRHCQRLGHRQRSRRDLDPSADEAGADATT